MGFFSKLFKSNTQQQQQQQQQQPEDLYLITITNKKVGMDHPKFGSEEIDWNDITEIKLINTDEGPWLPDVWLALIGTNSKCIIPQGSKGYEEVYNIVSKYNNFNFENVIKSMSCAENAEFPLWLKE
ncbi:MAG: hypothetical protein MK105_18160 [Crocinitomicaceae bacterium]|nr:hypothetical protein [Crocinitomicaceae bacterium]